MKRCPECRRDYYDDTLSFCLEDGTPLVYGVSSDEPATAILSEPPAVSGGLTQPTVHLTGAEAEPQETSGELSERQSPSANRAAEPQGEGGSRQRLFAVVGIAVIILVGGFFGYRYFKPAGTEQINSIAVLPFQNKSGDPNTEYLSDGLAESLIYRLSQLPNLKVSPTSSVIRYKGKDTDVAKIASELGVDAVMTGRLAQIGDNLTISVELVDVRTGKLLWGEQYDRKMSDLLATQREIAKEIANKLQLKMSGNDKGLNKTYTNNNDAYQLYLKGRYHWDKRTKDDIKRGIEYFQQAIRLDPEFASAYVGIADSYNSMPGLSIAPTKETVPQAKAAVERALSIDPTLAEAHAARATSLALLDFDWAESEREFIRAIELDPNVAHSRYRYAIDYLLPMGRTDEAIREIERAVELEPINLTINFNLAGAYMYARQYERALEKAKKTHGLDPGFGAGSNWVATMYNANGMYTEAIAVCEPSVKNSPPGLNCLTQTGYAYAKTGRRREAEEIITRFKEIGKIQYSSLITIAAIYAALGKTDEAFATLDEAIEQRAFSVSRLKVDPRFDPLRDDPRFKDLLKRMNLPE